MIYVEHENENAVAAAKTLKEVCGGKQFVEFEKFEKCFQYFFEIITTEVTTKMSGLKFVFDCRELNPKYQKLTHDLKI